jgi:hypothetical protein
MRSLENICKQFDWFILCFIFTVNTHIAVQSFPYNLIVLPSRVILPNKEMVLPNKAHLSIFLTFIQHDNSMTLLFQNHLPEIPDICFSSCFGDDKRIALLVSLQKFIY